MSTPYTLSQVRDYIRYTKTGWDEIEISFPSSVRGYRDKFRVTLINQGAEVTVAGPGRGGFRLAYAYVLHFRSREVGPVFIDEKLMEAVRYGGSFVGPARNDDLWRSCFVHGVNEARKRLLQQRKEREW